MACNVGQVNAFPKRGWLRRFSWFCLFLWPALAAHLLVAPGSCSRGPRAVLAVLAGEDHPSDTLLPISPLEDSFNPRDQNHWFLVRNEQLGEHCRHITPNVTGATCIYEITPRDDGVSPSQAWSSSQKVRHWIWNPFSNIGGTQGYVWPEGVERGVELTQTPELGQFRVRRHRDRGAEYDFCSGARDASKLVDLTSRIISIIERNPHLLHSGAEVSWILYDAQKDQAHGTLGEGDRDDLLNGKDGLRASDQGISFEGSAGHTICLDADSPQAAPDDNYNDENEEYYSLVDALPSWSTNIYDPSLSSSLEIGPLPFFKSQSDQALLGPLKFLELDCSTVETGPLNTISASIVLPKQSLWNLRRKVTGQVFMPEPTANMEGTLLETEDEADSRRSDRGTWVPWLGNRKTGLEAQFALWNLMATDLRQQNDGPGLQSGNTVIDERNFALLQQPRRPSALHI